MSNLLGSYDIWSFGRAAAYACVYVSGARARTSKAEGDRGGEGEKRACLAS